MPQVVGDVRALNFPKGGGLVETPVTLGDTRVITLATVGAPQQLAGENRSRKRIVIEVRSAGANVYVGKSSRIRASGGTGIRLARGRDLIDEQPDVHVGEWWADADAVPCDVAVTEAA